MSDSSVSLERFFGRIRRELGGRVCELTGQELTDDQKEEIATGMLHIMIMELGGCRLTFPDMADYQRMQRDNLIRSQFNGCNLSELSIRHGISQAQVRRIVCERAKTS